MKDYIYVACIIVCILIFPTSGVPVNPTALFELGVAYHMDGRTEMAKEFYLLVLNFEEHFEHKSRYLPRYKQKAADNLRRLRIDELVKKSPIFKRGK